MRDVFYTLLVTWIIWRILSAFSSVKTKQTINTPPDSSQQGKTTVVDKSSPKKNFGDNEGEYVDFEEVK